MTRTPLSLGAGALAIALAAGALSSCGTVPAAAATVNGTDINRRDFERDLKELAANPSLMGASEPSTTTIEGQSARSWLTSLITWKTAEELLAAHDLEPTQEAVEAVTSQLDEGVAKDLPQAMKDEVIQGAAAVQSLSTVPAPTADELAARYAESPAATGAVCARHIVVETEAEADAVVQELADGADFAELAVERSIEPAAADTGGALAGEDGNACLPVSTYQSQIDADFTAGALVAEVGVPTEPIKSQFGWHVILVRPYDEVADDLAALVATAPGDVALAGALVTADVTVDPRYGQWDRATTSVVSLH